MGKKRPNIREYTNIVENIFISGLSQNTLNSKIQKILIIDIRINNQIDNLSPEILLVFPKENNKIEGAMLNVLIILTY